MRCYTVSLVIERNVDYILLLFSCNAIAIHSLTFNDIKYCIRLDTYTLRVTASRVHVVAY